jgi:PIN domain nuclease of toxin-antitoxin system
MNLLLDTNALILFFEGSSNLSNNAKAAIESSNKIIFVSVISFWEIALKTSISKLEMNLSMEELEKWFGKMVLKFCPSELFIL